MHLMVRSDVLLRSAAERERAATLARSEATVLRASAGAAGIAHAAVRPVLSRAVTRAALL